MNINDKRALLDKAAKLNIEIHFEDLMSKAIFLCPRIPDEATKASLVQDLHDYTPEFVPGMKSKSLVKIQSILTFNKINYQLAEENKVLKIEGASAGPYDDTLDLFTKVSEIILSDGYFEAWEITLDNTTKTFKRRELETLARVANEVRPARGRITDDDILNLRIQLWEGCLTVESFINAI